MACLCSLNKFKNLNYKYNTIYSYKDNLKNTLKMYWF